MSILITVVIIDERAAAGMRNGYFTKLICILSSILLLTGCAYASELPFDKNGNSDNGFTTLGLSPEFDYEVPESIPSILVDQVGYAQGSNKVAVFQG